MKYTAEQFEFDFTPLSREFLIARGKCCYNGCKNCPYKDENELTTDTDSANIEK